MLAQAELSSLRTGSRLVDVVFVVDKITLGQIFVPSTSFSLVSIIPAVLIIHSFTTDVT